MDLLDTHIYQDAGESGLRSVAAAFYRRVPGDDILGPLYNLDDLAGAETRLADFLVMRFGGPQTYLETRGHPRLRLRHHRFHIDQAARDRWIELMESALQEAAFPPAVDASLRRFVRQAATFLINRATSAR